MLDTIERENKEMANPRGNNKLSIPVVKPKNKRQLPTGILSHILLDEQDSTRLVNRDAVDIAKPRLSEIQKARIADQQKLRGPRMSGSNPVQKRNCSIWNWRTI
jgi:hypothetical protein